MRIGALTRESFFNTDRLLAIRIAKPGPHNLLLQFASYGFFLELAISAASLAGVALISWILITGWLKTWETNNSSLKKWSAQPTLWVIS